MLRTAGGAERAQRCGQQGSRAGPCVALIPWVAFGFCSERDGKTEGDLG